MYKEYELQTISDWVVAPSSQDAENLASKSHETRRIPDPYIFLIRNGKLITPSGQLVEDSVLRGTGVYDAEYQALLKIQKWASDNDQGTALWFSPPYHDGYTALKIVASKILYAVSGEKVLFNRAIVVDVGILESLNIANSLSDKFFANPEELRSEPVFPEGQDWLNILEPYTEQTNQIRSSVDLKIKTETLSRINGFYKVAKAQGMTIYQARGYAEIEARERGLIGEKEDSCAVGKSSAFETFFDGGVIEAVGSFPCPRCNGPIPSGLGITTCPYCGLTKEQAGSNCG